jgi:hypothetical protein
MEVALRNLLLNHAGVAALVAARVHMDARPQAEGLPAITFQIISGVRAQTYAGAEDFINGRVQIDLWAADPNSRLALKRAVIAALASASGDPWRSALRIENEQSTREPGDGPDAAGAVDFYRTRFDVRVEHIEA